MVAVVVLVDGGTSDADDRRLRKQHKSSRVSGGWIDGVLLFEQMWLITFSSKTQALGTARFNLRSHQLSRSPNGVGVTHAGAPSANCLASSSSDSNKPASTLCVVGIHRWSSTAFISRPGSKLEKMLLHGML